MLVTRMGSTRQSVGNSSPPGWDGLIRIETPERVASKLVLRRCRCGLCHVAPPSWLIGRSVPGVRVLARDVDDGLPEALTSPLLLVLDDWLQKPSLEAVERLEGKPLGD